MENPKALYVNINMGKEDCPKKLRNQSIFINEDIGKVLNLLKKQA